MAILITRDLLYNFRAAPLTNDSFGTGNFVQKFPQIFVQYLIFFGLTGSILFIYTLVALIFDRCVLHRCCRFVFGAHSELQNGVLKIMGYMVVFLLLVGTMTFNVLLFYYSNDAPSTAFWAAIQPLDCTLRSSRAVTF